MPRRNSLLPLIVLFGISSAYGQSLESTRQALGNGQLEQAATAIALLRETIPEDPELKLLMAELTWRRGDTPQALEQLRALARAYPNRPEPLNNQAVILARAGNLSAARELLEAALGLEPGFRETFANLGDVYAALAAEAYRQALGDEAELGSMPAFELSRRLLPAFSCAPTP